MPLVEVTMFEGRTTEQKRELVSKMTDLLVDTIGTKKDSVTVLIRDISKENWGTAGYLRSEKESFTLKL